MYMRIVAKGIGVSMMCSVRQRYVFNWVSYVHYYERFLLAVLVEG